MFMFTKKSAVAAIMSLVVIMAVVPAIPANAAVGNISWQYDSSRNVYVVTRVDSESTDSSGVITQTTTTKTIPAALFNSTDPFNPKGSNGSNNGGSHEIVDNRSTLEKKADANISVISKYAEDLGWETGEITKTSETKSTVKKTIQFVVDQDDSIDGSQWTMTYQTVTTKKSGKKIVTRWYTKEGKRTSVKQVKADLMTYAEKLIAK